MIVDALLIALFIARPSIGFAAWVALMILVRHTPRLADELADMCRLDSYSGWTATVIAVLLPAHDMSSGEVPEKNDRSTPVHVPVPGTGDTTAIRPADRDIMIAAWIDHMARAKDKQGRDIFSANQIHAAVGGHRATVLDQVRAARDDTPATFRSDDGSAGPATYPISKAP